MLENSKIMVFEKKETHYDGELREVNMFAFIPITIGLKTVWLEKVTIYQKYRGYWIGWKNYSFK